MNMSYTREDFNKFQEDKDKSTDLLDKLISYIELIHDENNDLRNKLNEASSIIFKLSSEIDYLQELLNSRSFGESMGDTEDLHLVIPTRLLH